MTPGFTRRAALRGARGALPMMVGTVPFGLVVGILAQGHGLSLAELGLMSGFCYAGSAQILALGQWAAPLPILAIAVSTLVVNLRLALMGPVLAPWLERVRGWRLWGSLFLMADQNWALSVDAMRRGEGDAALLFGSGAALWVTWMATTLAGFLLGGLVQPMPGHPVFFAALAVFIALLAGFWRGRSEAMPWLVAAGVSAATARLLPGSWFMVLGALAGSLAGTLRDAARERMQG